jgi:hypothetical protein
MPPNRALDAAIALSRVPGLVVAMRSQALPTGVKLLLRILANETDALKEARHMSGLGEPDLVAVAEFYVLQVMLHRGASSPRILGVTADADRTEIRAHMRYLLNWLHPDKNTSAWHASFASRVIAAWRRIDRGLEDEKPRSLAAGTRRSGRSYRVSWVALPLQPAPEVPTRRSVKRLRVFLVGLTLVREAAARVSGWFDAGLRDHGPR